MQPRGKPAGGLHSAKTLIYTAHTRMRLTSNIPAFILSLRSKCNNFLITYDMNYVIIGIYTRFK